MSISAVSGALISEFQTFLDRRQFSWRIERVWSGGGGVGEGILSRRSESGVGVSSGGVAGGGVWGGVGVGWREKGVARGERMDLVALVG